MITSNKGRIYLFRIDTGELRGTITIPLHAKDCSIDPSGLYVLVQVPPYNPHTAIHLTSEGTIGLTQDEEGFGTTAQGESEIERTTVLMYEVGTGNIASEIKSVFSIAKMAFSSDGRYLSLASKKGCVAVWALGNHLYQNMRQVLESVDLQPDFWSNYPIFLKDYQPDGPE